MRNCEMSKKVFISHSAVDSKLINIVIEFLNKFGISNDDIFCTSISGTLEGGRHFVEQIKNNVFDSKVVIFLMSERFFLSYFCLAELGAAWALNQNILPVIVPPISITEYNSTPLIGIQALSMGNPTFASDFYKDLLRKNVIVIDTEIDKEKLFNNFDLKIKDEIKILRKDSKGFYVARLVEKSVHPVSYQKQMPCNHFLVGGGLCNYVVSGNETRWKLNGLLDIETDTNVLSHWVDVGVVNLLGTKVQFKIGKLIDKGKDYKIYAIGEFYPLP